MVFLSYLPGPRTDSEGVLFSIRHRSCTLAGMLHLGEIRAGRSHSRPDGLDGHVPGSTRVRGPGLACRGQVAAGREGNPKGTVSEQPAPVGHSISVLRCTHDGG